MASDNISKHYTAAFYEFQRTGSYRGAIKFFQHLFTHYMPRSIVDFGAGVGTWLAAAKQFGISDLLAIDGDWVKDVEQVDSSIPYIVHDLEERIDLENHFDLAISLEVAEHLTPSRAATFIDDICRASDLVICSAAMKDQGESITSMSKTQATGLNSLDWVLTNILTSSVLRSGVMTLSSLGIFRIYFYLLEWVIQERFYCRIILSWILFTLAYSLPRFNLRDLV
jgi:SAM-dependent methyltransferase